MLASDPLLARIISIYHSIHTCKEPCFFVPLPHHLYHSPAAGEASLDGVLPVFLAVTRLATGVVVVVGHGAR